MARSLFMRTAYITGRRALILTICVCAIPARTIAQPEVWASRYDAATPSAAIHIFNLATGGELARLDAPSGVCVGSGAMTPDHRSFLVPVQGGLARIDTRTRQLAEVIPRPGDCSGWVRVARSGRWWYVRTGTQYQIIDAVSRQFVRSEADSSVVAVDIDTTRHFELRATGPTAVLQAWPQSATLSAPLWARALEGTPAQDLAVDGDNVYAAASTADTVTLYRLEAATGVERARRTLGSAPRALHYFNGVVYIARLAFTIEAYNADTLQPLGAIDLAGPGTIRDLFVDTVHNTAYAVSYGTTSIPKPFPVTYLTAFEPGSLRVVRTAVLSWTGSARFTSPFGVALGVVEPPRQVQITGLDVMGHIIRLAWRPDAAGPAPWSFEIRAARRGEPLAAILTLAASARAWESPPLPSGNYAIQVVARNGAGDSDPSSAVVFGINQLLPPEAPQGPSTSDSRDDVARIDWVAPISGATPYGYLIEAAPVGNAANFRWVAATTLPRFSAVDVPAGDWWVRVRGVTAGGTGSPGGPALLIARRCAGAPNPPYFLAALTTGHLVTLQWTPTHAQRYILDITTWMGRTVPFQLEVPGTGASFEAAAPPGVYLVEVRARNACGTSEPSNAVVITVP